MTPEGQNFWDTFAEHLVKFKEDCKNLSEQTKVRLTEDPASKLSNSPLSLVSTIYLFIYFLSVAVKKKSASSPEPEATIAAVRLHFS